MLKSLLSRLSAKKGTRLRHVLYLGSLVEKQAEAFYRNLAQQAYSEDVKELYVRMAEEEKNHFSFINDILSGWIPLPAEKGDLEAMDAGSRLRNLFSSYPSPDATEEEVTEYAMNAEKKMVIFYLDFEKEFASEWKKMRLWDMIEEEKSHVAKLSDMLSSLRERKAIAEK
jgi:rubrerythrin